MTIKRFSLRVLLILLLISLGLLFPYETTVVPRWKLRIVDEQGVPYVGVKTREVWMHYSLSLTGGDNEEERWTDNDGYVEFPRRTIRMSAIRRLGLTTLTAINSLMHGSTGVHAYVMAWGPEGVKDINYEPDEPPPNALILPRHE